MEARAASAYSNTTTQIQLLVRLMFTSFMVSAMTHCGSSCRTTTAPHRHGDRRADTSGDQEVTSADDPAKRRQGDDVTKEGQPSAIVGELVLGTYQHRGQVRPDGGLRRVGHPAVGSD